LVLAVDALQVERQLALTNAAEVGVRIHETRVDESSGEVDNLGGIATELLDAVGVTHIHDLAVLDRDSADRNGGRVTGVHRGVDENQVGGIVCGGSAGRDECEQESS